MEILGIDFGGSGIKGAPVNIETGELTQDRYRIPTPQPALPLSVAHTIKLICEHFEWNGPFGCGFPAVVQNGVARTAANIDQSWIGTDVMELFAEATGCPATVINDADAAALAEMTFGAGKDQKGDVLLLTVGTGIGSALFIGGCLLPNTELGHIYLPNGFKGEHYASDAVRKRDDLSWKTWAYRFNEYLTYLEFLLNPDLIILGGGLCKKMEKFSDYLSPRAPLVPARLRNSAGIVGAALAAARKVTVK